MPRSIRSSITKTNASGPESKVEAESRMPASFPNNAASSPSPNNSPASLLEDVFSVSSMKVIDAEIKSDNDFLLPLKQGLAELMGQPWFKFYVTTLDRVPSVRDVKNLYKDYLPILVECISRHPNPSYHFYSSNAVGALCQISLELVGEVLEMLPFPGVAQGASTPAEVMPSIHFLPVYQLIWPARATEEKLLAEAGSFLRGLFQKKPPSEIEQSNPEERKLCTRNTKDIFINNIVRNTRLNINGKTESRETFLQAWFGGLTPEEEEFLYGFDPGLLDYVEGLLSNAYTVDGKRYFFKFGDEKHLTLNRDAKKFYCSTDSLPIYILYMGNPRYYRKKKIDSMEEGPKAERDNDGLEILVRTDAGLKIRKVYDEEAVKAILEQGDLLPICQVRLEAILNFFNISRGSRTPEVALDITITSDYSGFKYAGPNEIPQLKSRLQVLPEETDIIALRRVTMAKESFLLNDKIDTKKKVEDIFQLNWEVDDISWEVQYLWKGFSRLQHSVTESRFGKLCGLSQEAKFKQFEEKERNFKNKLFLVFLELFEQIMKGKLIKDKLHVLQYLAKQCVESSQGESASSSSSSSSYQSVVVEARVRLEQDRIKIDTYCKLDLPQLLEEFQINQNFGQEILEACKSFLSELNNHDFLTLLRILKGRFFYETKDVLDKLQGPIVLGSVASALNPLLNESQKLVKYYIENIFNIMRSAVDIICIQREISADFLQPAANADIKNVAEKCPTKNTFDFLAQTVLSPVKKKSRIAALQICIDNNASFSVGESSVKAKRLNFLKRLKKDNILTFEYLEAPLPNYRPSAENMLLYGDIPRFLSAKNTLKLFQRGPFIRSAESLVVADVLIQCLRVYPPIPVNIRIAALAIDMACVSSGFAMGRWPLVNLLKSLSRARSIPRWLNTLIVINTALTLYVSLMDLVVSFYEYKNPNDKSMDDAPFWGLYGLIAIIPTLWTLFWYHVYPQSEDRWFEEKGKSFETAVDFATRTLINHRIMEMFLSIWNMNSGPNQLILLAPAGILGALQAVRDSSLSKSTGHEIIKLAREASSVFTSHAIAAALIYRVWKRVLDISLQELFPMGPTPEQLDNINAYLPPLPLRIAGGAYIGIVLAAGGLYTLVRRAQFVKEYNRSKFAYRPKPQLLVKEGQTVDHEAGPYTALQDTTPTSVELSSRAQAVSGALTSVRPAQSASSNSSAPATDYYKMMLARDANTVSTVVSPIPDSQRSTSTKTLSTNPFD